MSLRLMSRRPVRARSVAARLGLTAFAVGSLGLAACGPGYLTPEEVRLHIESPGGEVSSNTIGFAADDLFRAKRASGAESNAFGIKGSSAALPMTQAASFANPVADAFCAASLVASIASFDDCADSDNNCEAEFVIDSCVLRLGEDGGDINADGRIRFLIKNTTDGDRTDEELRITFEAFSVSVGDDGVEDLVEQMDGIIAVAATSFADGSREEVIFSADVDYTKRIPDPALFEDGVTERTRMTAALRFVEVNEDGFQSGSIDLVAFVDETDDTRDESVILTFAAESRDIGNLELTNATLEMRGTNGSFLCTFQSAEETLGNETASYSSEGSCLDRDTGEEFNWASDFERNASS